MAPCMADIPTYTGNRLRLLGNRTKERKAVLLSRFHNVYIFAHWLRIWFMASVVGIIYYNTTVLQHSIVDQRM